jgi:tRNA (guanine37-N1)-methyltransferase
MSSSEATWALRRKNDFENAKAQCLGKRDKSFAGRIDPHAVEICGILNEREDGFTTSSCAGRCFLYRGSGIKSTQNFTRFRISHEKIEDPVRFFDLTTIDADPSGGGDPIRTIGQYDHYNNNNADDDKEKTPKEGSEPPADQAIWMRFEPFILHVACRSLSAASALMAAARPAFKNVGLTTWKENRYLVAIWGDEGLDMPLSLPCGTPLFEKNSSWLAELVNERHERNWNKIARFCTSAREMTPPSDDLIAEGEEMIPNGTTQAVPKSFDVIGDVAYLHSMPEGDSMEVGNAIMTKNKSIKLVVARSQNLDGTERAPGENGLTIIAGAHRAPLITTHTEYGIKCVVDLNHTFFSPRMAQERLRICQNVARGEAVLVLFAGVGMEAVQIAGRTEASSVVAVELNEVAVQCAHRAHRMLGRNKAVKCSGAADRLRLIQGDVLEVLPNQLETNHFDRILAPRPKEGALDGDLGSGDGGETFLDALLPHLKDGGECHWYDFAADHEYPECERTKGLIQKVCQKHGLDMEVLHVARVGSIAKRQLRVCMDFKIFRR